MPLRARFSYAVCGLLLVLPASGLAISVDYISAKFRDSSCCSAVIARLASGMEKQVPAHRWKAVPPGKRDSLINVLRQSYVGLSAFAANTAPCLTQALTGLILLYLEQLGFPGSYPTAETFFAAWAQRYPGERIFTWMRGLHAVNSGRVFGGIRLLDSLRVSGFNDEEFLADYARAVFYAFIHPENDSLQFFVRADDNTSYADTLRPIVFSWNIVNSQRAELPFFDYRTTFVFRKPFSLVFSGLGPRPTGNGWLSYQTLKPQSDASVNLMSQLADRRENASFTVHIDVNNVAISPYEYLVRRISGMYDSIEVKPDLPNLRATSLRCYNRIFSGSREGTYTAYVVFDRSDREVFHKGQAPDKSGLLVPGKAIRFTLTMRCALEVKEQAEAKLQAMIRAF